MLLFLGVIVSVAYSLRPVYRVHIPFLSVLLFLVVNGPDMSLFVPIDGDRNSLIATLLTQGLSVVRGGLHT